MQNEESDRGFISGFLCVGIHRTIQHIIQHIHIAHCCKNELADLKVLVMSIELTIMHIQQNRLAFKTNNEDKASAVNGWLKEMDRLLLQASKMVQRCSMPKSHVKFSGFQTERKIRCLISEIEGHLKSSPLHVQTPEGQVGDTQKVLEGLGQTKARVEALASSAATSQAALAPRGEVIENLIEEQDIVGQEQLFAYLKNSLLDDAQDCKIGLLGECGSGKTLLMRKVFNTQKVRNHFNNGLWLWLNVSKSQSLSSVMNQLRRQIAVQTKEEEDRNVNPDDKKWLEEIVESKKIALFIDDLRVGELLEGLASQLELVKNHRNCKLIVSSRDRTALSKIGVPDGCTKEMKGLTEEESWKLLRDQFPNNNESWKFCDQFPNNNESWKLFCHQFLNNNENLHSNIENKEGKLFACKGFPLAIKVVGRAMARSSQPQQWKWALDRLEKAERFDDFLRLGFDAVGNEDANMQLCFLHLAAAFFEDEVIDVQEAIPLWMGEGLLAMKMLQNGPAHVLTDRSFNEPMIINTEGFPVCLRMQDPFEIGRLYVDQLAERCLIEPMVRDADGRVVCFGMLNVLRDLAIEIAKKRENFYCSVDKSLKDSPKIQSSDSTRIFLSSNELTSLPRFSSSSAMCSLFISQNNRLTKIPNKVMASMMFLKVLDLSGTLASSLPEDVGCLKQLACLKLSGMRIKRLPKSLTGLGHLEILDVSFTSIKVLPSDIHMLRSLRYLSLRGCKDLQNLPYSISALLSLQYLYMDGCSSWTKPSTNRCQKVMAGSRKWTKLARNKYKEVASMESLSDLIQLKKLALQNDWEAISEDKLKGTVGSMTEMDTLLLIFPKMENFSLDINNMSKLRSLSLKCCNLTKMEIKMKNDVCRLENLTYLKFYECPMLEELQNLDKLPNLKHLEIILCQKVENFPREFGEKGAFPSLKIFSLVGLENLKELPERKEGAMPSLAIFNIIDCSHVKMLPGTYLKGRTRVTVYGGSLKDIEESLKDIEEGDKDMVQVIENSTSTKEIIKKYLQVFHKNEDKNQDWLLGESWCNEMVLFVKGYIVNSRAMSMKIGY